jgi:hypothetical protein
MLCSKGTVNLKHVISFTKGSVIANAVQIYHQYV